MVYYLKLNQKTWGAGDYVNDNSLGLTGTIYSDEALSSVVNISTYTLKIKVYPKERPDWYQLSEDAEIVSGSGGTWRYKPTINKLDDSGVYKVVIQLSKTDERISAVGIKGSDELLVRNVPTTT
jgi:hypothetical protein|tara:strand:- start:279 stop:650 length:372 start_codon:yes stop_codon:yes gene_type:complete